MPRKLVTVRRISGKRPITGADRIEVCLVDGWSCITKKDEFQPGDLAVFFEVDSFLPASDERWAFLEKSFTTFEEKQGFRVRTIKMKGTMSQGLLKTMADFPEIGKVLNELESQHGSADAIPKIMEMSFEEALGVLKWENLGPDFVAMQAKPELQVAMGQFPDFITRTDQERIQNLRTVFEKWSDEVFQETTKMDGSSMTVYFLRKDHPMYELLPLFNPTGGNTGDMAKGRLGVCSRNIELVERDNSWFWSVAHKNKLPEKLEKLDRNIAIQGELCGSSVQSNFEGFPSGFHDFYMFSVWDIDEQRYLPPRETEQWAKDLGLKHVPVHGYAKLKELGTTVKELLKRAEGTGINGKKREGIVFKHEGGEFSFKAISNSYLLKHGE